MSELKVIVANVEGEKLVCTDNGDGTGTTVCRLSEVPAMQKEIEQLREQLHSLFERVSSCEISEFDESQLPYLADMIEGQMDADEGCIQKLRKDLEIANVALRLINKCGVMGGKAMKRYAKEALAKLNQQGE